MHVAAVVAGFDPQSGGGHTFEQEILEALRQAAASSAHRFTVLCPEASSPALAAELSGSALGVAAVPQPGRGAEPWSVNRRSNIAGRMTVGCWWGASSASEGSESAAQISKFVNHGTWSWVLAGNGFGTASDHAVTFSVTMVSSPVTHVTLCGLGQGLTQHKS